MKLKWTSCNGFCSLSYFLKFSYTELGVLTVNLQNPHSSLAQIKPKILAITLHWVKTVMQISSACWKEFECSLMILSLGPSFIQFRILALRAIVLALGGRYLSLLFRTVPNHVRSGSESSSEPRLPFLRVGFLCLELSLSSVLTSPSGRLKSVLGILSNRLDRLTSSTHYGIARV
jgi:hypothetical protein